MLNISKIELLIKEKGWTKVFFCRQFNHSRTWIDDWKRGRGLPDENMLRAIADKLDTTVDYLTDKTDIKTEPVKIEEEQVYKIKKLFEEKGLPFDERTVGFFLDFVAANAEIIKKQVEENK